MRRDVPNVLMAMAVVLFLFYIVFWTIIVPFVMDIVETSVFWIVDFYRRAKARRSEG